MAGRFASDVRLLAGFCVKYLADTSFTLRQTHSLFISRYFEDIELQKDKDSKYRFKKDGRKHTLIIQEATLDDIGMYHAWTNGGHTKGELEVEGAKNAYEWWMFLLHLSCFFLKIMLIKHRLYFLTRFTIYLVWSLNFLFRAEDAAEFNCAAWGLNGFFLQSNKQLVATAAMSCRWCTVCHVCH